MMPDSVPSVEKLCREDAHVLKLLPETQLVSREQTQCFGQNPLQENEETFLTDQRVALVIFEEITLGTHDCENNASKFPTESK